MSTIEIALFCLAGGFIGALLGKLTIWLITGIKQDEQRWIAETLAQRGSETADLNVPNLSDTFREFGIVPLIGLSTLCVVLALFIGLRLGVSPRTIALMIFGSILMTLALVDIKTMLLPDGLTQPLLWLGFLVQIVPATRTVGLEDSVLGAAIGYSVLWVVGALFMQIRQREGLGQGDLKLFSAIGAWLGLASLSSILLMAASMALFWQLIVFAWRQSGFKNTFAFGPWLALGAMIYLLFRF